MSQKVHILKSFIRLICFILIGFQSFAMAPQKSTPCLLSMLAVESVDFGDKNLVYTMNALRAMDQFRFKGEEVKGNNEEFLFIPGEKFDASAYNTAKGRLAGIIKFAENGTNSEMGNYQITRSLNIQGIEKTNEFLDLMLSGYGEVDAASIRKLVKLFSKSWFVPALPWATLIAGNHDVISSGFVLGIALLGHLFNKHDIFIRWLFNYDRNYKNSMNNLKEFAESGEPGSIAMFSRNFKIEDRIVDLFSAENLSSESLGEKAYLQAILDNTPTTEIPIRNALYHTRWVAMDIIMEKSLGGEVETYLVVRSTKDMPVYPNPVKEKKPESLKSLEPVLSPVTVDRK